MKQRTRLLFLIFLVVSTISTAQLSPKFTFCLDGDEFLYFSESRNFENARTECGTLGEGSFLARISSDIEFEAVKSRRQSNRIGNFWIGVEGTEVDGASTARMFYSDGTADPSLLGFIRGTFGEPPWTNDNPSNSDNRENCVNWQASADLWNDLPCSTSRPFMCRRPCLTGVPTTSPTKSPSLSPTRSPTDSPSKFPTESPTLAPTRSPTNFTNSTVEEVLSGVSLVFVALASGSFALVLLLSLVMYRENKTMRILEEKHSILSLQLNSL